MMVLVGTTTYYVPTYYCSGTEEHATIRRLIILHYRNVFQGAKMGSWLLASAPLARSSPSLSNGASTSGQSTRKLHVVCTHTRQDLAVSGSSTMPPYQSMCSATVIRMISRVT
jgi:hypothetical protein